MNEHVTIILPAYNEERVIADVIRALKDRGYRRIIVVDDCSKDRTNEVAKQEGAVVLRHFLNRGVGGALGTGIQAALRFDSDIIVTFDSDGQHDPDDIPRLIEPIEKGDADAVIGTRLSDPRGMPWSRRLANWTANCITFALFGVWTTDSQSGMRAFSRAAAQKLQLMTSGMEASSEIVAEIARNRCKLKEVPITVIYTEYSLSKGQSFLRGLATLRKLLIAKVRRLNG